MNTVIPNHQKNLMLADLSNPDFWGMLHHIIGWKDVQHKRVPLTAIPELEAAFLYGSGWGLKIEGGRIHGFLLYDRDIKQYFNPQAGERYTEEYLVATIRYERSRLKKQESCVGKC